MWHGRARRVGSGRGVRAAGALLLALNIRRLLHAGELSERVAAAVSEVEELFLQNRYLRV